MSSVAALSVYGIRITPIRVVLLIAVAALTIGSLLPADVVAMPSGKDKPAHFLAYLTVCGLAMASVRSTSRRWFCFLGLVGLGISLEFAQVMVPGRTFDPSDVVANVFGAGIAFSAACLAGP